MKSEHAISLLAVYLLGLVAGSAGLVICVRSDGKSSLVPANHCCKPGGCDGPDRVDAHDHGDHHMSLTHGRCCLDVPVSLICDQEITAPVVEAGTASCVEHPVIEPFEPIIANQRYLSPFKLDKGPPDHIDSIILLI